MDKSPCLHRQTVESTTPNIGFVATSVFLLNDETKALKIFVYKAFVYKKD